MARKHKHEEHLNHEAWAIPYGDLMTLLLAFFVVMYAVSSVNEGRYRVMADSLSQAFGGPPKSMQPVQIGDKPVKGAQANAMFTTPSMRGFEKEASMLKQNQKARAVIGEQTGPARKTSEDAQRELARMAMAVESALSDLIRSGMVVIRRSDAGLEIEIRTDILFASGAAELSPASQPVLRKLARVLTPFPQALRIEGHTDNVPIATSVYPSNWELSAARAASVVHLMMQSGLPPARMSVAGFGEYRPVADNAVAEGRNRNRRVVIVAIADRTDALDADAIADSISSPAAAAPAAPADLQNSEAAP